MICNAQTRKGLKVIKGFVCDGQTYRVLDICGTSVVVARIALVDAKDHDFLLVRWERGRGWRQAGTNSKADLSRYYYPVIGDISEIDQ